ncbi:glycoside hydrolase family 13 protein [Myceligenerans indicum]|uniref:Glycoside hydrolase family 13 protein n=1 Tax=Myceligenerans indicum TaxID=2593663 RepID=A0ABS1LJZ3_9MICO|nr:glycoside hydrolase family 13 protein [Myceligenerans indicum]MBL0886438.1 glycoside hydrolase family 13 protein [Myceligenerans indicum]
MPLTHDPDWWRQAVVYQVYPRSFADSDGDGIGDLAGVTSRVDHLRDLGVDAVWLSPFYPSALADGGYDVDDYRDVDPRLGTLADFDTMVAALHEAGIRVVVDIVPNHSSNRHEWFAEALASPKGSPARDRYVFRDGLGPDGAEPPSDWVSMFGGPAWEPVGDGQWYLHLFAPEQPDWNWSNPEVRQDFLTTLRFWADRGVDGFRVDVAHALAKDLSADPLPSQADLVPVDEVLDGSHPLWDRDELTEIYARWRAVFDEYDPPRVAVAEAWVHPARRHRYAGADSLGQAFNFDLLRADFAAADFRRIIDHNLAATARTGSSNTWVLSNHDVVRHRTRYGLPDDHGRGGATGREWLLSGGTSPRVDDEQGLRRARAAVLFLLALPGSAYLYQGEELGLPEVASIRDEARQDPTFYRSPGVDVGRDGCRVPIPWRAAAPSAGFGPSAASHLPQPDGWAEFAVDRQDGVEGSTLELYREALALRHKLQGAETLEWTDVGDPDVLAFERPGGWGVVVNFSGREVSLPGGEVLLASGPCDGAVLPPETAVWLRRP